MEISIVNVFAIIGAVIVRAAVLDIAAVGAIFIIVADVVDVISSSRTTTNPSTPSTKASSPEKKTAEERNLSRKTSSFK